MTYVKAKSGRKWYRRRDPAKTECNDMEAANMKRPMFMLCSSLLASPLSADDPLVAPSYSRADRVDAKRLQVGSVEFGGNSEQRAYFLVGDELESVIEFYSRQGIEPGKPKRSRLSGVAADLYFAEVLDPSEPIKRLEDDTLARRAGVQMLVSQAREPGFCFGALRDSVARVHHRHQELDQREARYGWLESCVSLPMQSDDGSWQPADEVLAERCFASQHAGFSAAAVELDESARNMQKLMAEGKMDEAMAWSQHIAAGPDNIGDVASAGSWDQGMELLEELEKLAYRVVLIIDQQPERWRAP
jgi:hypothetical protein